jgi:hypothetical protein
MKKSYSALVQPSGGEINQFATISTDGQVLLWEKKFLDNQKKIITDVRISKSLVLNSELESRVWISFVPSRRWRSDGGLSNRLQSK